MAKRSKIVRNEQRKVVVKRYKEIRAELKKKVKDHNLGLAERTEAMIKLQRLPRNGSATRVVNRCAITGRPRGFHRKFGVSRIALRELALKGELPGMVKASW